MKVLLISANTERINLLTLPLGLALVGAAVRASGHEVILLDLLREGDPASTTRQAIQTLQPDVIGISVRNIDDQCLEGPRFLLGQVTGLVATCRTYSPAPVVLGGAGYSIFPVAALAYLGADFGVCGEGEATFLALLARLERGEDPAGLRGVYAKGRGGMPPTLASNLDAFPLPSGDLWPTADPARPDLWIPVQSRRGCALDCSYCSTASIEGRGERARDPRRVVAEIARLARAGSRRFYFVDNTFNRPLEYALALCRWIASERLDIAWRCILYPHEVPEALVRAMAEAGCEEVGLGFESGSERILQVMNKQFLPTEVREISERLADHGIRRMGFLLLGGPGETQDTVDESLAFTASLRPDLLKVTAGIRIYPGTSLSRTAIGEGVIRADDDLLFPRFYLTPGLTLPDFPAPAPLA